MNANESEVTAEKEEIKELARGHIDSRTNGGGGRINYCLPILCLILLCYREKSEGNCRLSESGFSAKEDL